MFLFGKKRAKDKLFKNITRNVDPLSVWKIVGDLGEGSFGMVHKVEHRETKQLAAAKIIPVKYDEEIEDFVVEVDILTICKHANIIQLQGAYFHKEKLWVIMELCAGGALDDVLLELETGLEERQIRVITRQLLEALVHLHANFVIHRDIKAGNVLLSVDGNVKLTDFGVSALNKKEGQKRDTFIGTPYWMAPEVVICENVRDRPYNEKCDIWSLGITLIELAEMSPPYHDMHPMRVLFKIPKAHPPTLNEPEKWSSEFSSFLEQALIKDPSKRPSAAELLQHPFVATATSAAPIRDLMKLADAEVTEVLEDISEEEAERIKAKSVQDLTKMSQPQGDDDDTSSNHSNLGSPTKASQPATPGPATPRTQFPTPMSPPTPATPTPQPSPAAQLAAQLDASRLENDDDGESSVLEKKAGRSEEDARKIKTLTRTRKYVNEDGQEVTLTTKRVVETALESNRPMTFKRGAANIASDWQMQEQKKLAIFRKEQLRETKLLQREEQKECASLIVDLKVERDQLEERQRKETTELERDHDRLISQQQIAAKRDLERLERAQSVQLVAHGKALKQQQQRDHKQLKAKHAEDVRALKGSVSGVSKDERKVELRSRRDELETAQGREEAEFLSQQETEYNMEMARLEEAQKLERRAKEDENLATEQQLVNNRFQAVSNMGERQLLEKQQMLKHQQAAIFKMQKYQMHFRHEKESEQLKSFHEKKISDLEKRFLSEKKLLPKKQKAVMSQRKKQLKRQLSREMLTERLAELETTEQRKMKQEQMHLEEAFSNALEAARRAQAQELKELEQMQATKKQLLSANETAKMKELQERHSEELKEHREKMRQAHAQMLDMFDAQLMNLKSYYKTSSPERTIDIGSDLTNFAST
eukprot:m.110632 g.110632  ORF g.110632 m.110632 type:complete len:878 (+) comp19198_c1_seq2:156-2789(+)